MQEQLRHRRSLLNLNNDTFYLLFIRPSLPEPIHRLVVKAPVVEVGASKIAARIDDRGGRHFPAGDLVAGLQSLPGVFQRTVQPRTGSVIRLSVRATTPRETWLRKKSRGGEASYGPCVPAS